MERERKAEKKKGDEEREKKEGYNVERVGWEIKLFCLYVLRFGTIIITERKKKG